METKFKSPSEPKTFIPFSLEIKVETIEDARLMWHLYNCCNLNTILDKSSHYADIVDLEGTAQNLDDEADIWEKINDHIEDCGFEV